jgi:hypothetical protein
MAAVDSGYTVAAMAIRKPVSSKPHAPRPRTTRKRKLNIWEQIVELGNSIPDAELARMPRDGARNFDHYLDGSPKQY